MLTEKRDALSTWRCLFDKIRCFRILCFYVHQIVNVTIWVHTNFVIVFSV